VIKSPYIESHFGGAARAFGSCLVAVLNESMVLEDRVVVVCLKV